MARQLPLTVTFRDVPETPAIINRLQAKANKLLTFFSRIEFCKVTLEIVQNHKHKGKLFSVKIEIAVPGKILTVTHKRDEDLYVAMRDAFAAMEKQLKHYSHILRGEVKTHHEPISGHIVRLFNDYGFIKGVDGREFYFNQYYLTNSDFTELDIGDMVHFLESASPDGLTANHISVAEEKV